MYIIDRVEGLGSCVQLAPSQANSSQNSNVNNFLPDLHNMPTLLFEILRTLHD